MNPELYIRRPVLTTLLMAAILIFGIMAYRLLPVSDLPNVDFPTIQVQAALPGASPETMASAIATPLEKQFTTIAGIDSMTSSSAQGLTAITIQFSLDRSIDRAAQANVNKPTGTLYGQHQSFVVQATGQLTDAAAYRPLIVTYRNGSPVRLEQLGRVIDSVQTDKVASWYNDERAVILAIQRQPGTNTVEVVDAIRALLPKFRQELPGSVNLNVLYDRSVAIRESVSDVQFTLGLAIALVVMVIFLFLRNVSATIIPSLAVPMSLVGTFAVMYALGYTIDIISLMALTLSVGFVVGAAVLVSGVVSLTLTPMLCSRFLKPPAESHNRLFMLSERFFDGMLHVYDKSLRWVMIHRWVTVVSLIISLAVTAWAFRTIPKGFIPNEDTGQIFAFTEAAQDISFDAMREKQQAVAAIVQKDPYVEQFMWSVGAGGVNIVPNTGRLFIRLKPHDQRPPVEQIIQELRPKLATVPGINVYPQVLPTIRIGGQLTKALYQYTLQSTDLTELYHWAPILFERMRALPDFTDVNTDLLITSPQIRVDIDRDRASAMGVTADQIEVALGAAYGATQVSTIYTPANQYWVILELDPAYQRDPSQLPRLYVRSSQAKLVPLDAVARLTPALGPLTVNHLGQLPSVTISFNLKEGVSLSQAVSQIQQVVRA